MKNHIGIFLYSLDGGGVERVVINLANSFIEKGLKVDLLLAKASGPYLSRLSTKIRVFDLGVRRTPEALLKLISYLKKEKPDSLLSAMHYANEVSILAKIVSGVHTKVVVSEHNCISQYAINQIHSSKRWIPLSAKILYPFADEIIAVSQGVADDLRDTSNLGNKIIKVFYNPVVTSDLLDKALVPLDHPWFAHGQPPVILGVGRLTQQKDFPTLIRAFSIVRSKMDARLLILGEDFGEKLKLESLIKSLGLTEDISMVGFVDNPYQYMASSAVFVLSSMYEGFGNVIAEALAVGVPVVSTDCRSGPAEILSNGKYGDLVPVGDKDLLANSIIKAIENPPKPVPIEWLEQFTPSVVVEQYLQVLECSLRDQRVI